MGYKVLLVDDDLNLLPSLVTLLEELSDFTIVTAIDGRQALECVVTEQPDCMVIDVRMPELTGYQLVQVIRGDPETANIPVVILSALVQERDKWTGLVVGADRYLTKPVESMELIATIYEAIQRSEQDRLLSLQQIETFGTIPE